MKSLLIFPPGWNPCSPYLALPIIKSYLIENIGYNLTIKDINLDFFDYILSEEYLNDCLDRISTKSIPNHIRNTINMFKDSIKDINYAKNTMRTLKYLNPNERKHVDTVLSNAIYIINTSWSDLKISFNGIDLKYRKTSSAEVFMVCKDDAVNPYIEYYEKKVVPYIKNENFNFIGISIAGDSQLISALTLCKMIKEQCINVEHISLGGNYITRAADMICNSGRFNKGFFDSVMLYDGEISCKEIIQALSSNAPLEDVHNLIFKKNEQWIHTKFLVNDIINTSAPDFSDLPLDKYFAPATIYPIYTSRSCYNKCAFCTIPNATSGHYRALPISSIINNIKTIKEKYNAQYFTIVDETFDIDRMLKVSKALIEEKLNIYWYCETRFSPNISFEACKCLYQSGCRQIQFGLESYNQRVLDKMEKNIKIEWIDNSIENCLKAKIPVHMFFFTGFPTETYEEAMKTYLYTNKKVTESQLKYKIISSRGYGTFGLEIGSTVWLHPEEFGVTIIKNEKENDLRLNGDYLSKDGLSQYESETLVKSQNLREGLRNQKATDYELPWIDFIPEIHMAIKASVSPEIIEKSITYALSIENLTNVINTQKIYISEWISLSQVESGILFYNRYLNRAYFMPSEYVKETIAPGIFQYKEIFSSNSEDALSHIALLHHFSFIEIEALNRQDVVLSKDTKLVKAKTITGYYNKILKEWVFLNKITYNSVAMNQLSYQLLELFTMPLSFNDFLRLLKDNQIILPYTKLVELINYSLQHDILYALH